MNGMRLLPWSGQSSKGIKLIQTTITKRQKGLRDREEMPVEH